MTVAGCSGSKGGGGATSTPQTITIGIEPWDVQPGEDRIWCKMMKVPSTATLDINSVKITMSPGSHHFILYRSTTSLPDGFGACPPMGAQTLVTGSQNPGVFEYAYPAGLANPLFAGDQLILQTHYVNASPNVIQGKIDVDLNTIPHSQVTDYVQTFLVIDDTFTIPANTTGYSDGGLDENELPGLNLLSVSSHMHKRGVHFTIDEVDAGSNKTPLFDTTQWDAPPITTFSPARPSDSSKKLHYQCTWNNETNAPIVFGPTTEDEMCIMVVTVFPALSYHP